VHRLRPTSSMKIVCAAIHDGGLVTDCCPWRDDSVLRVRSIQVGWRASAAAKIAIEIVSTAALVAFSCRIIISLITRRICPHVRGNSIARRSRGRWSSPCAFVHRSGANPVNLSIARAPGFRRVSTQLKAHVATVVAAFATHLCRVTIERAPGYS
jgi:hypothetical protein